MRIAAVVMVLGLVSAVCAAAPSAQMKKGFEAQQVGDHRGAIAALSAALVEQPACAECLYRRAVSYVRLGERDTTDSLASRAEYDSAVTDLNAAIALDTASANAWYLRGTIHLTRRSADLALRDMSRAIRVNARFADAYKARGRAYQRLGSLDSALTDFTAAITFSPYDVAALRGRASVHIDKKDYGRASEDLTKVLTMVAGPYSRETERTRAEVLKVRATCLLQIGEFGKALSDFRASVGGLGRDGRTQIAHAWADRAKTAVRASQYDLAVTLYANAIEFNPGFTLAYAGRAKAYFQLAKFDKSQADCDTVLAHNPESYLDLVQRGHAYRGMGKGALALADFRKALALAKSAGEVTDSLSSAVKALEKEAQ